MSTPDTRLRLVFRGSAILLLGLFRGLPSVIEVWAGSSRMWQGAHPALLIFGVWLVPAGAVVPLPLLEACEAAGPRWSLLPRART